MADPLPLRILRTVGNNKPVAIDYLSFRLGSSRSDIENSLVHLKNQGLVELLTDDKVQLAPASELNRTRTAIE